MITGADMGVYSSADKKVNGGLGNKMFVIASTIGIAVKQGYDFGFNWNNQEYFVNPLPKLEGKFRPIGVPWGYHDVVCADNSILHGYMQSEKYFDHCADLIRHYFEMKPICEPLVNSVGIHFRDYTTEGVVSCHPEPTTEYYHEALKEFPGLEPVVFTDNIERAKKVVALDCEYISKSPIEDFYLLKNCDGVIGGNSSFSWWAGWLGKKAVMPKIWFGGRKAGYNTNDLYAKKFIIK